MTITNWDGLAVGIGVITSLLTLGLVVFHQERRIDEDIRTQVRRENLRRIHNARFRVPGRNPKVKID